MYPVEQKNRYRARLLASLKHVAGVTPTMFPALRVNLLAKFEAIYPNIPEGPYRALFSGRKIPPALKMAHERFLLLTDMLSALGEPASVKSKTRLLRGLERVA